MALARRAVDEHACTFSFVDLMIRSPSQACTYSPICVTESGGPSVKPLPPPPLPLPPLPGLPPLPARGGETDRSAAWAAWQHSQRTAPGDEQARTSEAHGGHEPGTSTSCKE